MVSLSDTLRQQRLRQARTMMARGMEFSASPDALSDALDVAPIIPPNEALMYPEEYRSSVVDDQQARDLAQYAPFTVDWMAEAPENAVLVKDELPAMVDFERTIARHLDMRERSNGVRGWQNAKLFGGDVLNGFMYFNAQGDYSRSAVLLERYRMAAEAAAAGEPVDYDAMGLTLEFGDMQERFIIEAFLQRSPEEREQVIQQLVKEVLENEGDVLRYAAELRRLQAERERVNYTSVSDMRDIRSASDLAEWAVVNGVPGLATTALIAGATALTLPIGGAGGAVAAAAIAGGLGTGMAFGGIVSEQVAALEDPLMYTPDMAMRARTAALLSGSLEAFLGPTSRLSAVAFRTLTNRAARREVFSAVSDEVMRRTSQGYLRRVGSAFLRDGVEEFIAEGAQTFIEQWAVEGDDFRFDNETLWQALNGAALGGLTGGTFGMAIGARQAIRLERLAREERDAGFTVKTMEELQAVSSRLKLPQRQPRRMQSLMRRFGLDRTEVFFQSSAIEDYAAANNLPGAQVAAELGINTNDYQAALASGGRVPAKASAIVPALAGDRADFIKQNASMTETGATPQEAQRIAELADEIAEQAAAERDVEGLTGTRKIVYDKILKQVKATKKYDPQQAESTAAITTAFYEVMASRYGQASALSMYRAMGLDIESDITRARAEREAAQVATQEITQLAAAQSEALSTISQLENQLAAADPAAQAAIQLQLDDAKAALQEVEQRLAEARTQPREGQTLEQAGLDQTLTNIQPDGDSPDRISTRLPWTARAQEDPMAENLIIGLDAMKANPEAFAFNMDILKNSNSYPGFATTATDPDQIAEEFIEFVMGNLRWIYNQIDPAIRDRSRLWYKGARAITERLAADYNLPDYKIAAVMAALSPQKDWYQNVSLAERVLDIYTTYTTGNQAAFPATPEMAETAKRIYGAEKYAADLEVVLKSSLGALDESVHKAMWVRLYDETYNPRGYRIVSSEGEFMGDPEGKVGWGSNKEISKAIRSIEAQTRDEISAEMGTKHKVRNFFNNILAPDAPHGDVTIDTHAVAASLLLPLSGNSPSVHHNFGSSPERSKQPEGWQAMKNIGDAGAHGSYGIYAEAHRRLAAELGIYPRELQSITWEAVRGIFSPKQKSNKAFVDSVVAVWSENANASDLDAVRARIVNEIAGGINDPTWLSGPDSELAASQVDASYSGELADLRVSRRAARGLVDGDGGPTGTAGGAGGGTLFQSPADRAAAGRGRPEAVRGGGRGDARGRTRSGSLSPLEGAPTVRGVSGPDPQLVEVAERYAESIGLDLRRQAEFVEVDPDFAARVAAAYEAMEHDPQNPEVAEAYDNLIKQTVAQYEALVDAGYTFYFIDLDSQEGQDYAASPWNAMFDVRENKTMGVFSTAEGFGTKEDFDPAANPLLADTGFKWPLGPGGELRPVYANDLFRAVHDAFGHGLEWAGFRARGEENAWQAHVRLFTGSAVAAITSETRGQNSWLNYGPYGETNRTASVEDTVFADQKTGLMPEWTWTENRAADDVAEGVRAFEQDGDRGRTLEQRRDDGPRGQIFLPENVMSERSVITLFKNADPSTIIHELGHFFLKGFNDIAALPDAPQAMKDDMATLNEWLGRDDPSAPFTVEQQEKFAQTFEKYIETGKAPSIQLRSHFERFRRWIVNVYRAFGGLIIDEAPQEVLDVLDRMLATDDQIAIAKAEHDIGSMLKQKPEGMSQSEWDAYVKLVTEHDDEAHAALLEKTMADIRRRRTKEVADRRTAIKAQVTERVQARPEYRVVQKMTAKDGVRLNKAALTKEFGEGVVQALEKHTSKTGRKVFGSEQVNNDAVAHQLGYAELQALIDDLVELPGAQEAIEAETRQRLREEFADILDDGSIREAAIAALHGDKNRQVMSADERFLHGLFKANNATPPDRRTVAEIKSGIEEEFAGSSVSRVTKTNMFLREEREAAAAAQKAWSQVAKRLAGRTRAEGDVVTDLRAAYDAKVRQIEAHYRYNASRAATDLLTKVHRKAKQVSKASAGQRIAAEELAVIHGILAKFDFRVLTRAQIQNGIDAGLYIQLASRSDGDNVPFVDELAFNEQSPAVATLKTHYTQMTLEQLSDLNRIVDNLIHVGRERKRVIDLGEKAELALDRTAVISQLARRKDDDPLKKGVWNNLIGNIRGFFLSLSTLDGVLQALDLARSDEIGIIQSTVFTPVFDGMNAADAEVADNATFFASGIWQQAFGENWKRESKRIYQTEVTATIGGKRRKIGLDELIGIFLNVGNDINFERVTNETSKSQVTKAELERLSREHMTEGMWRLVKAHWDRHEQDWARIVEQERKITGVAPEKVETKIQISNAPSFVRGGGYHPIMYERELSPGTTVDQTLQQEVDNMSSGRLSNIQTRHGHVKQRVSSTGQPLRYDLRTSLQHWNQVSRDIHLRLPLARANRILKNKQVGEMFAQKNLVQEYDFLRKTLEHVAAGERPAEKGFEWLEQQLRSGVSTAAMAASITTIVQQPLGLFNAANIVGAGAVGSAIASYSANPRALAQFVLTNSPIMRERAANYQRDARLALEQIKMREYGSASALLRGRDLVQAVGFGVIGKLQFYGVDVVTWQAAYGKGMKQGMTHEEAVSYAERLVARSQGSGQIIDRAGAERGGPLAKTMTTFMTFVLTRLSATQARIRNVGVEPTAENIYDLAMDIAVAYLLPSFFAQFLTGRLFDEEEADEIEDKGLLYWWASTQLYKELLAGPYIDGVVSTWEGYGSEDAAGSAIGDIAMGLRAPVDMMLEGELTTRGITSTVTGIGILFKLPSVQINRIIREVFADDQLSLDELSVIEALYGKELTFID